MNKAYDNAAKPLLSEELIFHKPDSSVESVKKDLAKCSNKEDHGANPTDKQIIR